jgi:hypothetical protein
MGMAMLAPEVIVATAHLELQALVLENQRASVMVLAVGLRVIDVNVKPVEVDRTVL